ncbi:MAG: pentapeptide repeat-containing protein [Ktedonobacteraceae bacterium]
MHPTSHPSRLSGTVLVGADAYRASLSASSLTQADLEQIVDAARAGDHTARERLAELCLCRAWRRSLRLAAFYRALRGVELDPQDIAQEAALRVWLRMDKALAHPNPFGYLCRATEGAMLTFCRERQTAVRVPVTMQWRGTPPATVVSLDAPLSIAERTVTLADLLPAS